MDIKNSSVNKVMVLREILQNLKRQGGATEAHVYAVAGLARYWNVGETVIAVINATGGLFGLSEHDDERNDYLDLAIFWLTEQSLNEIPF